jgi:hypothetical protein
MFAAIIGHGCRFVEDIGKSTKTKITLAAHQVINSS